MQQNIDDDCMSERSGHHQGEPVAVGWQRAAAQAAALAGVVETLRADEARAADFFGVDQWGMSQFMDAVEKDGVAQVLFDQAGNNLMALDTEGGRHMVKVLASEGPEILKTLRDHAVQFSVQGAADPNPFVVAANLFFNVAFTIIPLVFIGGILARFIGSFFNRGEGGEDGGGGFGPMGGGNNPLSMLNSKSKIQMEPNTGVTFDDVAGCDESKLELTEVVDFLKTPEKYSKVGAKIPRGVLLEGPPGTGKTLLARACAGEAGVPFISASGSEFVEMFTGVGASRIRGLFADAKKNSPCIVFIDEIDAIGRQRSGGGGFATNDEREQTLNQILTEMDGFGGNTGVIVIAATNRADILDSALLRPGRFDRRVPVDLPDLSGRVEILKVHCRDKPLTPDVELDAIASRTIGFSGASLANLMNEAAIVAARRNKEQISFEEIDFAIDRITVGLEKRTGMTTESRKRLVAYHEAGHAIMAALTDDYDAVAKVTIVPRSNGAGGFTLFTPSQDRLDSGMYSLRYLKGQLSVALGGRVAEEIVFGDEQVTTGASNDLQQVRSLARRMIAQWGFSRNLAASAWEAPDQGGGMGGGQGASETTELLIDAEVTSLVDDAYNHCYETLRRNRNLLDATVDELLEKETIDGKELNELIQQLGSAKALAV